MQNQRTKAVLANHTSEAIIAALEPFVTERRKARIEAVIEGRLNSIQLAIESPSDINNALAAVRTCEALGISTIHLINPEGDGRGIRAITQGAFYWVTMHFHDTLTDFLAWAKEHNLALAGGAVNATQTLHEVSIEKPLCIMIGNEQRGLTPEAQAACTITYKIPMVGMSESLNLSVSAAISLYDTTTRKREALQKPGDLTETQQLHTRAKYYLNSVNPRLIDALLNIS